MTTPPPPDTSDAAQIKACCAATYGRDAVALLLGEHYHPGGASLTRRLADLLTLRPGHRVVDVAAGPGATARLLATEHGVTVDGVDLYPGTVARAHAEAARAGLDDAVRFHVGDAEGLPLPDAAFDAVVCECALCTFPDKQRAVGEFARLLRPGGRVGITDVTTGPGALPPELTGLAGWVACLADARPVEGYRALLTAAGLRLHAVEQHDTALARMIDDLEARLKLLRMTAPQQLADAGVQVEAVLRHTRLARNAVDDGRLGYTLLIADKPAWQ